MAIVCISWVSGITETCPEPFNLRWLLIVTTTLTGDGAVMPILEMRKPGHREMKNLVPSQPPEK